MYHTLESTHWKFVPVKPLFSILDTRHWIKSIL